ncbi:hypothetical protein CMsap09_06605 [Clavibacter michiganensis]|uniref:Uncharacterized protein n=1 Tax=Clavibacter michiganensis TaxID=28447 RepID=A0A251XSZ6_9MICO|nr:hypothetical protein CMsap09_06605 [Clavibacter michiganensis]
MSEEADFVAAALEREGAWYRAEAERERLRSDLGFVARPSARCAAPCGTSAADARG